MNIATAVTDAEFRCMTRAPGLAWPTVGLFIACLTGLGLVDHAALTDRIGLWPAAIINGFITYFFFSVVHDASHGAIAQHKKLNDFFGHVGMLFFGPIAPFNFARWIHMQHHRFTNEPKRDPDHFGHKMDLLTPLRWLNFDYFYTRFFLQQAGDVRRRFALRLVIQVLFVIGVVATGFATGYGKEVVMLWLVPTRISSALFVLMFIYLPHAPFMATAQQDEYKASNIRAGWEPLLTPLMTYQNYHLVHHLYPTAPFYRMIKIWNARLDHHLAHAPYFVRTFSVGQPAGRKHVSGGQA